ncbi:hypothetical protein, partial [Novosphingobium sp. BW1]|uniref:hypothetical protein n=1 Tax=Novosphingobium sp. BW1 TaxID=2592621 RepID=UPI001966FCDD
MIPPHAPSQGLGLLRTILNGPATSDEGSGGVPGERGAGANFSATLQGLASLEGDTAPAPATVP